MFLNPFLLFGLTAVSVPIIIHLLNRRRFQRVTWAAMRFIQQAVEHNQRRIQVEDMILLALRCILIALIALALSRPVLQSGAGVLGGGGVTSVIVLDNSASMSQRDGPATRFEQAKALAARTVDNLPKGSSAALVLASDIAETVIAEPTLDLDAVRKGIAQATLSGRGSNVIPAMKKGIEILTGRPGARKELYTITDSQHAAWRQTGDAQRLISENKKEIGTTLIFTSDMATRNLAITGLRADSRIPVANQPLKFVAEVTNFGSSPVQNVEVALQIDGDKTIITKGNVGELRKDDKRSVLLTAKVAKDGYHTIRASIPHDEITADDTRSLAMRVVKQVQVLVVEPDIGARLRDQKSLYLQTALQPVDPALRESYFLQQRVVGPMDLSREKLDEYHVVILANVADVPAADIPALLRFVKSGGGLVVFPGAALNPASFNDQLFKKHALLPAGFGETRGDPGQRSRFLTFQSRDFRHPIAELWNEPKNGNPASVQFFKVYDLQLPPDRAKTDATDVVGETRVILAYNDGKPAIVEHAYGAGRVVQFSSGAETSWNDLGANAKVWVPLIERILGALVGRQDDILNVRAGGRFSMAMPSALGKEVLVNFTEDEKAPPQAAQVKVVDGVPVLQFDRTDRAGAYTAAVGAESVKFTASVTEEESSIESVSKQQVADLQAAGAAIIKWQPGMQVDDALRRASTGTEWWFRLAMAALVLAATEMVLAHYFSRPK